MSLRNSSYRENPWVWVAFGAVLLLYIVSALRIGPVSTFGTNLDDALYFSSAKALASGKGYILPSFPIRLKATKYPEMYPLLLAGVWKVDPHFPGNINVAVGLTLAFGCLALLFAFLLLRRWPELGDWRALAVVTLCAFTEYFLYLSACVMTDVPFMAAVLGAIWLEGTFQGKRRPASRDGIETRPGHGPDGGLGFSIGAGAASAIGAGLLAGISVGLRSLGMAAVAGIGLVLLVRRDYRRAFWFSLGSAPLIMLFLWPELVALFPHSGARPAVGLMSSGWAQTVCYYSSYACNWHLWTTGPGTLRAVLLTNFTRVLEEPGLRLLSPLLGRNTLWKLVMVMLMSAATCAGIVRYAKKAGWHPLPVTLLFYLTLILPWPWTPDRFLVPFLPLFFGGLWVEGQHFVALVIEHLSPKHSRTERAVARLFAAGAVALLVVVVCNLAYSTPRELASLATRNRRILFDQREAYTWIRKHAAPNARVIANDDGLEYLYTGRRALPAIMWLPQAFYLKDAQFAEQNADRIEDVARHVHASYWIVSDQDFRLNGDPDFLVLQRRVQQLLANSHVEFESTDGAVRLYDVRCLAGQANGGCTKQDWATRGVRHPLRAASFPGKSATHRQQGP